MLNCFNYRVLDLISQMRSEQRATYEAKGNGCFAWIGTAMFGMSKSSCCNGQGETIGCADGWQDSRDVLTCIDPWPRPHQWTLPLPISEKGKARFNCGTCLAIHAVNELLFGPEKTQ
jgi:hypothetical protein